MESAYQRKSSDMTEAYAPGRNWTMIRKLLSGSNAFALLGCLVLMAMYGIHTCNLVIGLFLVAVGCFLYTSDTVLRVMEHDLS